MEDCGLKLRKTLYKPLCQSTWSISLDDNDDDDDDDEKEALKEY